MRQNSLDDSIEFWSRTSAGSTTGLHSELTGVLVADDISSVLEANGYAPSVESDRAVFVTEVGWPGSPAFFSNDHLGGRIDMRVDDGRFLRDSDSGGALRLVSFINLSAIFQRLRFSGDLVRNGLAFDEITGEFDINDGLLQIKDRLVISGPSSLYQINGEVDLAEETVEGEMSITLPVSNNLPWIGLLSSISLWLLGLICLIRSSAVRSTVCPARSIPCQARLRVWSLSSSKPLVLRQRAKHNLRPNRFLLPRPGQILPVSV